MESLSDDVILCMGRFVNDPADLARFASTCRRMYLLCNPLPLILSHKFYALSQQPMFLEFAETTADRALWTTSHCRKDSSPLPLNRPCHVFLFHTASNRRAYLGRFERTRVLLQPQLQGAEDSGPHGEAQIGLAWKIGPAEEYWTIRANNSSPDFVTMFCHGTEIDSRGWIKARDLTSDKGPKGLKMDDLGKCYICCKRGPQEGSLVRLTPYATWNRHRCLTNPPLLPALSIPTVPKPLFSHGGKISVFEPASATDTNNIDFWDHLPPPSELHVAIEFDCTLDQGIFRVHARLMGFSVAIPVLEEDALHTVADYRYFLLHLFRRNSGRWETLLTYFMHAVRRILPPHPQLHVRAATALWPTGHRDHSYEVWNDSILFIQVKDGVIDKQAPRILPTVDPWKLLLCSV